MTAPAPHVVFASENGIVGSYGNVIVWRWLGAPNDETLAVVRREVATLLKASPDGIGSLHVIQLPDATFPDDVQRKKIVQLRVDCAYAIQASALLFEGDGIRGAIIRSLVTAVMLASGNKRPQVVFGTAPAAITWLRAQLGTPAPDALGLARAIALVKETEPGSTR